MKKTRASHSMPWLTAALVCAVVLVLLLGARMTNRDPVDAALPEDSSLFPANGRSAPFSESVETALVYARAFQAGDCEPVIAMTDWMQQRLEWVRGHGGAPEAEQAARQELCERIAVRDPAGNRLRREGIEDRYVFLPGASVEVASVDAGRQDLSAETARRVWLRVSYTSPESAPRDEAGRAVSSLLAGVNLSAGGRGLKAGIVGTVEIDDMSISRDWN